MAESFVGEPCALCRNAGRAKSPTKATARAKGDRPRKAAAVWMDGAACSVVFPPTRSRQRGRFRGFRSFWLRRSEPNLISRPLEGEARALAAPAFGVVVIARRLLDRAVLRLLHRLRQRHAGARRFGQITRAQPVRAEFPRIQTRHRAAPLNDQIDRLRGDRPLFKRAPAVDGAKIGPLAMSARSSQSFSASTGGPISSARASSSAPCVLVRPS